MPSLPIDNEVVGSNLDLYRRYFGRWKSQTPPNARVLFLQFLGIVCGVGVGLSTIFYIFESIYYNDASGYKSSHLYYVHNLDFPINCILLVWSILLMLFSFNKSNFKFTLMIAVVTNLFFYIISCVFASLYYNSTEKNSFWNSSFNSSKFCDIFDCTQWSAYSFFSLVLLFPLTLLFAPLLMYYSYFYCCKSINKLDKEIEWQEQFVELNKQKSGSYRAPALGLLDDGAQGTDAAGNDVSDEEEELNNDSNADETQNTKSKTTTLTVDYDDGSAAPPKKSSATTADEEENDFYERGDSSRLIKYSLSSLTITEFKETTSQMVHSHMIMYGLLLIFILIVWFFALTLQPNKKLIDSSKFALFLMLLLVYHVGKYALKRIARRVDRARVIGIISFEMTTEMIMSSFYYFNFRKFLVLYVIESVTIIIIIFALHIGIEIFESIIRPNDLWFNWTPGLEICKNQEKKSNIIQWKVRCALDTSIRFIISVFSGLSFGFVYLLELYDTEELKGDKLNNSLMYNYVSLAIEIAIFSLILFTYCTSGNIRSSGRNLNLAEPLMRLYSVHGKFFILTFVSACVTMFTLTTH